MSKIYFLLAFCLFAGNNLHAQVNRNSPGHDSWENLKLEWTHAEKTDQNNYSGCPIGNSKIGAKIKGGVERDVYQLNNKTFWSGGPRNTDDSRRRAALIEVRKKLAANDISGADQAARGMWDEQEVGTYLPLGNLEMSFPETQGFKNYTRTLDINRSVCTITYQIGEVLYKRESFASFPDNVIVIRISASRPRSINFTAKLKYHPQMEGHGGAVGSGGKGLLSMTSKAQILVNNKQSWDEKKGMIAQTQLNVQNDGGKIVDTDSSITVHNANTVLMILANETSYNGPFKEPGTAGLNAAALVKTDIEKASKKSYEELLASHIKDYQSIFQRVSLEINGDAINPYALGFQYARYEMISVSRTGDRPHNQQGMWNHNWRPMSNCSHFLNENVEKYYSLIETANLAECGEPLWNWMDELAITGARTAKTDWGFKGWLAPHYSDIWASTTLKGGNNEWAVWPMGGIWLCENLWDHYEFSMDKEFLEKRAYPLMKGAAEFCLDLLVDDGNGYLVTSPSTSPENQFEIDGKHYAVSQGATMDLALIKQLFAHCMQAASVLGIDQEFAAKLKVNSKKILGYQINSMGELQEWSKDFVQHYPKHRHASHLVSVWPLSQITEQQTPDLFKAAKVALDNRLTGGYHPDKGAMWARLKDGDRSLSSADSYYTNTRLTGQFPPKYSGLPEMLVQSHAGEIELLPALPSTWKSGKVKGLRARGGYELYLEWNNGELVSCQIDSKTGAIPVIRYKGELVKAGQNPRITVNFMK